MQRSRPRILVIGYHALDVTVPVGGMPGVDGKIECTFGDQTVLPEVTESAPTPRLSEDRHQLAREPELVPSAVERDAHLSGGHLVNVGHLAARAVGERALSV